MAIDFRRSWSDEDLDSYRDTVVRFIETEMLPHDAEARKLGNVGHAIWRQAGALGTIVAGRICDRLVKKGASILGSRKIVVFVRCSHGHISPFKGCGR